MQLTSQVNSLRTTGQSSTAEVMGRIRQLVSGNHRSAGVSCPVHLENQWKSWNETCKSRAVFYFGVKDLVPCCYRFMRTMSLLKF